MDPLPSLWTEPCEGGLRFEVVSRGDWVPGRLFLPSGPGPFPLILVQHGAGSSKDDPIMDTVSAPWVEGGAAVARLDFPLHGERTDAKLTGRVLAALAEGSGASSLDLGLWPDLHAQAVSDLRQAVSALSGRDEIDGERVGYAGFSLGGILGAAFCASDPRVRVAALALAGGGLAPSPFDPTDHVGAFAPRPLLLVNARDDQRIPQARAEALHAAAGQASEVAWFDGGHGELPGAALKRIWRFLAGPLGL